MSISQITGGGAVSVTVDTRQDVKTAPVVAKPVPESTVAPAANTSHQPHDEITAKEIKNSVEQINRAIGLNNSVNLSLDHESGKVVVQVVDKETKTVLRQIPSAEVLQIARDLAGKKGVLLNDLA